MVVRRVRLGVEPAGEDDSRHLVLEQQLEVVGLGGAADGARAEHRREALLRERPGDHLGERGEDRVLQLRQDKPDEPCALSAQLRRALVAEDVQRGQHGLLASRRRRRACR